MSLAGVYAYRTLVVLLLEVTLSEWSTGILPVWQPGVSPGLEFLSAGRMPAGPAAKMAVFLKIQMRGSISNRTSGRQSRKKARTMKTTRTALK